jgi:hypothetical protein
LLSIDGLHDRDLRTFIARSPASALARLAQTGITYTHAFVNRIDGTPSNPSDSFPGLLALTTGGSSPTHGGWYDVSFARDLYPDDTCTTIGAAATFDESIELDDTGLWGNGQVAGPTHDITVTRRNISPKSLPWRKTLAGCSPVLPHDYLRVNTAFEVVHEAGLRTAWSDKHLAYEMVSGPSGRGLDDFFAPEINSLASNLPMPGVTPLPAPGDDFTRRSAYTQVYDDYKVQAILNQIDGKWSDDGAPDATGHPGTPTLFGMNFQALSVAQKDARAEDSGGYDTDGMPNAGTREALAHTDASIGRIVAALSSRGLLGSTLVVVTAKHGQSPIDHRTVVRKDPAAMTALVDRASAVAFHIEDDVALYWLKDAQAAPAGAAALTGAAGTANDPAIDTVFSSASPRFASMFGDPAMDPRTPDLVVRSKPGTIYSLSQSKWAEHGGFAEDDAHVGLLVSHPALAATTVDATVRTKQVAPTILAALCLDPTRLTAVQKEGTRVLPDVSFACAEAETPMRWTADAAPAPVVIAGGPWTTTQLAASGEPDVLGKTLTHRNYGYCAPFGPNGARQRNPGTAPMSPYYFPHVLGTGRTLQGFFDWRDKDTNESIVAARSEDGGRTWLFQDEAFTLTEACPLDDTKTNPDATAADDGVGHPYVVETAGVARLYALDRSLASVDDLGLVVTELGRTSAELAQITAHPLASAPKDVTDVTRPGLTRTIGLLNPDGILGVVPDDARTTVLYVQKRVGAAAAFPASARCSTQPYAPYGAKKPKAPNDDVATIRLATTTDGVHFTDLGAVSGLNDPTTTSYLGTRWVAPGGTILRVDAKRYGLFFSGGNCMDADSDAFHYIGYAESTDLVHWTVVNGIQNPIASVLQEVLTEGGASVTIPAQQPVVGQALPWFYSRVYSPSVAKLDDAHVTMMFAGYGVQSPDNDLRNYRTVGRVVLNAAQPLP